MRKRKKLADIQPVFRPGPSKYLLLTGKNLFLFLLFFLGIAFVWLLFRGGLFSIREINCERDGKLCSDQILAELERLKGQSLLTFKPQSLKLKLALADPSISEVNIRTNLPGSLKLTLISREAKVFLTTPRAAKGLIADADGFVFSKGDKENAYIATIVVNDLSSINLSERVQDPIILSAIKLSQELEESYITFQTIEVEENLLLVVLNEQTAVLFSSKADLKNQVTSLQRILSQATIEDTPTKIDVRFDKPVISFK